tara:strand:+ start:2401 stop:2565 length:165 start_codon:yes stop_codon:yes gene_type:complete
MIRKTMAEKLATAGTREELDAMVLALSGRGYALNDAEREAVNVRKIQLQRGAFR